MKLTILESNSTDPILNSTGAANAAWAPHKTVMVTIEIQLSLIADANMFFLRTTKFDFLLKSFMQYITAILHTWQDEIRRRVNFEI